MITHPSVSFDKTQPALVVQQGPTAHKHWGLLRSANTVGQARGCDIVLDAPEASSIHCLITIGPEGLTVRDCSSRTGTCVNGNRIWESPLHDGDVLTVGQFSLQVYIPASWSPQAAGGQPRSTPLNKDAAALALESQESRDRIKLANQELAERQARVEAEIQAKLQECHQRCEEMKKALTEREIRLANQEESQRTQAGEYELAKLELEEVRQQLDRDREALLAASQDLENRVQQLEKGQLERQAQVEADIQARLQECGQHCEEKNQALAARESELAGQEESLQNRLREYEQRKLLLVEARQQLDQDREALTANSQSLDDRTQRVDQAEEELRQRQAQVEADIQARLQECRRRCEETERTHAEGLKQKPSKGAGSGVRESGMFSTEEVQQRLRAIEAKLSSTRHPRP
jgi:pSer/pThr/pTyr-binding forkhead associated (FHA) protein